MIFCRVLVGLLVTASLAAATLAANAMAAETDRAAEIYAATGVQGGLIVHLGCGDGSLTMALHAGGAYLVHGLDPDADDVAAARKRIQLQGLYGKVSVDQLAGSELPYIDNLVNLVVAEQPGDVPTDEILRVLAPGGVAYVNDGGSWTKTVKPVPAEIDEWSHYLHEADNNAVAHDSQIGPPRHMQWLGGPRWSRHHDNMASLSALVSAGGRIFYIFDEGQTASLYTPSKWSLIARDAFNGTILWKSPIAEWHTRFWPLKSGPAQLPRRLVATADAVYATLGINAPVTALDAARGEKLRTYEGTKGTTEILVSEGVLYLVVDPALDMEKHTSPTAVNKPWWNGEIVQVVAVEAVSGKRLWEHKSAVLPLTLGVAGDGAFFHDGDCVVCLDRMTGKQRWRSEPVARCKQIMSFFAPTLVVRDGVVLFAGGEESGLVKSGGGARNNDTLTALDAGTGRKLWSADHLPSGYSSPEDVFVLGDTVWCGAVAGGGLSGEFVGYDLRTGKVKSRFPCDADTYWFHHRCYRGKATDNYLMVSRTGIEFIDPVKKHWDINNWVRGGCLYGFMPANGLIYAPPHDCICYPESKQFGFNALAGASPARAVPDSVPDAGRLERGPAYDQVQSVQAEETSPSDWATYRYDGARSGSTPTTVGLPLKQRWSVELGGRLTSPVLAEGKVLLASTDTHTVHALEAASGRTAWTYTTGGRVDSPPTVHNGLVLFGSADGYVYCLRLSDGALCWRFRAAPLDRRMSAYEQLESVWPVSGSVLVSDGVVHCVAGRSMFLDGGLRLLKLDPRSGRKLLEKVLDEHDPNSSGNLQKYVKWLNMPVALPDVLSTDGRYIYMRSQPFDKDGNRPRLGPVSADRYDVAKDQGGEWTHLFSPSGFLDDSWFHRAYWVYGRTFAGGWNGYFLAGKFVPAGRILVVDEGTVYGYGRKPEFYKWTTPIEHQLFAADKRPPDLSGGANGGEVRTLASAAPPKVRPGAKAKGGAAAKAKGGKAKKQEPEAPFQVHHRWTEDVPFLVRGMVLTGAPKSAANASKTLYLAGMPDVIDEAAIGKQFTSPVLLGQGPELDASIEGQKGGILWAVSTADGKRLASYRLVAPPVWDGLIAAHGHLIMATTDGKVVCLSGN
ncbi:MAG: PQQ-binding-like beta-propeller repeat protein [Planctomycetota bacterium]